MREGRERESLRTGYLQMSVGTPGMQGGGRQHTRLVDQFYDECEDFQVEGGDSIPQTLSSLPTEQLQEPHVHVRVRVGQDMDDDDLRDFEDYIWGEGGGSSGSTVPGGGGQPSSSSAAQSTSHGRMPPPTYCSTTPREPQ